MLVAGPKGLPFVGYAPFFNRHDPIYPHRGMMKLAHQYGPVVGFYMGPKQPMISVCGPEAVQDVLKNQDFDARPVSAAVKENFSANGKMTGFFLIQGQDFDEQNHFAVRHLIDFTKPNLENVFREEITDLLNELKGQCDSDPDGLVDFKGLFNISVINMLWAVVAGKRFQHDDAQLKRLQQGVEDMFRGGSLMAVSVPLPTVVFRLFPFLKNYFTVGNDLWAPMKQFIKVIPILN